MGKMIATKCLLFALLVSGCTASVREELRLDLDGDGSAETVSLSQRPNQVVVSIRGPALIGGKQTLSFGVDPARQDAVCGLPVILEITDPDCAPEALGSDPLDQLEGCKALPQSKGLALSDGMCDSIHMYWNHEKRQVWWWRL